MNVDDPDGAPNAGAEVVAAPKAGADDVVVPKPGALEVVVVPNVKPEVLAVAAPNWKGCEGAVVVAPKLKPPGAVPPDEPKAGAVGACVTCGLPKDEPVVPAPNAKPVPAALVAGIEDALPNTLAVPLGCVVERLVPKENPPALEVVVVGALCPKLKFPAALGWAVEAGACPKLNPAGAAVVAGAPCPKLNPVALVVTAVCPKAKPLATGAAVGCPPKLGITALDVLVVCPKLKPALDAGVEDGCPKPVPVFAAVPVAV